MSFHPMASFFILLGFAADYISTKWAISHGALEANPVFKGRSILGIKLVGTIAALLSIVPLPYETAYIVGIAVLTIYSLIALRNVEVVTKSKAQ